MIDITFLSADRPLVKSYALKDGVLTKESYPRVWEFTSRVETVNDLGGFACALDAGAQRGDCLLKGTLQRPLVCESRAGATDPNTPTLAACFDLDRGAGIPSFDAMFERVGLGDVSYVLQYSASYGIESRGLTGHAFMLFDREMLPSALKQYLMYINLNTPMLANLLALTKTNNALSWPLDITTCQNDKLIYIAPPLLGPGVVSSYSGPRIQYVEKKYERISTKSLVIPSAEENRRRAEEVLDKLRERAGLPKRRWTTRFDKRSGSDVLVRPDPATLTGIKVERGFTYFNLNGGDSWGYFHSSQNPEVIRNFKGEPNYLTSEILPEYWGLVQAEKAKREADAKQQLMEPSRSAGGSPLTLVFRDFRSAVYYNGVYDPTTERLDLARAASELQLQHFLLERGLPRLDSIPVWNVVYDPHSEKRVDVDTRTVNRYCPSEYSRRAIRGHAGSPARGLREVAPATEELLTACVGKSPELRAHFLNWFAFLFMIRERPQTAWTLQGVEGTGKGLLVNKVLVPILGASNVTIKRMQELEDQFNGYLEESLLVVVDEADISESRQSRMIMANLKNQITEPVVSIRKMHTQSYLVPNYCGFLFLSNMPAPVVIAATDRRFNVGEYMDKKFMPSDDFIKALEDENQAVANYLASLEIDRKAVRTVFESADRDRMRDTATNSIEATAQALIQGNLEFFWDNLPAGDAGIIGAESQALSDTYIALIHSALRTEDGVQKLTRDELRVLFAYNVGEVPRTPAKFTSLLRHHRIVVSPIRVKGQLVRGMEVKWNVDEKWKAERLEELHSKVPTLRVIGQN